MVKDLINQNSKFLLVSFLTSLLIGVVIFNTYPTGIKNEQCNQTAYNVLPTITISKITPDISPPVSTVSLATFEPLTINSNVKKFVKEVPDKIYDNDIFDKWTAIYDIKAHTVYLPDGSMLEAHSGRGDKMDKPNFVHIKDVGPTPPHIYQLSYRERPFHGVQALRLTPRNQKDIYNRVGLLAHPYFLGKRGDSKGCVSFKNYNAFLEAYKKGQFKRLAVVASLD